MRLCLLFILLCVLAAPCPARAELAVSQAELEAQTETITRIGADLLEDDAPVITLRGELINARAKASSLRDALEDDRETLAEELDRLGEAIEAEAEAVMRRRAQLQTQLRDAETALSQARLNVAEATRLLSEIAEIRRATFYSNIFERRTTPLAPVVIGEAAQTLTDATTRSSTVIREWVSAQADGTNRLRVGLILFGSLAFAVLMAIPVRRWISRRSAEHLEQLEPLPFRKVLAAMGRALARTAPAIIGGFAVYQAAILLDIIGPETATLAQVIWAGFVAVFLADGIATAVFSTRNPVWRIYNVSNAGAARLRILLVLSAVVIWIDAMIRQWLLAVGGSAEFDMVQRGGVAILLAVLLIALSRRGNLLPEAGEDGAPPRPEDSPFPSLLPVVGLALGGIILVAALLGYTAGAHFLAVRVFYLIGLFALAGTIRALLRESVRLFDQRFSSKRTPDDGDRLVFFWIGLLVDGSVVLLALPPALLLFGSDWSDVIAMVSDALLGFQIGSVRISILQIFLAIGLFGLLIAATRFIQRTAQKRLFPRTRMDLGVQNSLTTLIGYVGLLIAFMTAVGILGFDLSNLAIIAGALSVGIGFGLQSIVNNFVSGLILLFERPIKVGDWIVTGSGEGIVKRISVRSTEIETFDRSSIIIPNSELISGSVTNWTHKSKLGRVTVTVGVSYNEDPDKIMDILRGIPNQIDIVLNYPEPLILFTGFGDSSLDFEIRAFLADVGDSLKARTRIRVAIFKAFREAGVEIPFPQRDLHIRTGGVPTPDEG